MQHQIQQRIIDVQIAALKLKQPSLNQPRIFCSELHYNMLSGFSFEIYDANRIIV